MHLRSADGDDGGDGMHIVRDTQEDRFAAVAKLMRKRDAQDKRAAAELRRTIKSDKKARKKAREVSGSAFGGGVSCGAFGGPRVARIHVCGRGSLAACTSTFRSKRSSMYCHC